MRAAKTGSHKALGPGCRHRLPSCGARPAGGFLWKPPQGPKGPLPRAAGAGAGRAGGRRAAGPDIAKGLRAALPASPSIPKRKKEDVTW